MCNGFVVIILRFGGYCYYVPITDIFHCTVTTAVKNVIIWTFLY